MAMREIKGFMNFDAADVSAVFFATSVVTPSALAFCFAFAALSSAATIFELRAIRNAAIMVPLPVMNMVRKGSQQKEAKPALEHILD